MMLKNTLLLKELIEYGSDYLMKFYAVKLLTILIQNCVSYDTSLFLKGMHLNSCVSCQLVCPAYDFILCAK